MADRPAGLGARPRGSSAEAAASRVRLFLDALEARPELRQRMGAPSREMQPFHDLPADVESFRAAFAATPHEPAALEAAAARLRERLEACRQ